MDHEKVLYLSGLAQVLTGCLVGFVPAPRWRIPRYMLTAHLEFCLNGTLLCGFAAAWRHFVLSERAKTVLYVCAQIGTWTNGLAFVLASALGQTTELTPLANAQITGEKPALGPVPTNILKVCGVTMTSALALACFGLWQGLHKQ